VTRRRRDTTDADSGAKDAPVGRFGDLMKLTPTVRGRVLAVLSERERFELLYDWAFWGRPEQTPPPGDWVYWLILAGRGAGKTRAGAEAVRQWIKHFEIVNLIGATHDDARDVMVLGESGLMAICPSEERPFFTRASARLSWPNGATSQLFSAEEPDRLRGKQHMKLWLDELAAWRDPDAFDQAMLGLRIGPKPQAVITTTPRPIKLIKQLTADENAIVTRGTTFDNSHHLARAFLERIVARYEGKMIGRQELFAEIVEEAPGALWTRALLERQRLPPGTVADYSQIVIGVDPPAKSGAKADECGIVVAAKTPQGIIHVVADLTSQGETPGRWAARVAAAFRRFQANRVVAEINNGGDMVAEVLRQSDPNLPVRKVTATRGKFLRAEPVAAAYEQGIVFHLGDFGKLEDQLCTLTPDFDARVSGFSPDRADALVWAIADLLSPDQGGPEALLGYYDSLK
jgi:phage terminase large subunit-like protein